MGAPVAVIAELEEASHYAPEGSALEDCIGGLDHVVHVIQNLMEREENRGLYAHNCQISLDHVVHVIQNLKC